MRNKSLPGIGITFFVIFAGMITAMISDLSPQNDVWTNSNTINFTFTLDDYINKTCTLIIDGIEEQNKSAGNSNSFSNSLSEGMHTWMMNCSDGNISETSEERTIYVDLTAPVITISFPNNNTNYTNISSVTFTTLDNLVSSFNCTVNVNGDEQTVNVQNGTEKNVSISSTVGENIWNVSCQDTAGNIEVSETRNFIIENATEEIDSEFNITLEKSSYNIGEQALMQIVAVDDSNVTIDVCPNEQGFVLCYDSIEPSQKEFPRVEVMPYTNESGNYVITALMKHGSITKSYSLNYTVNNNLHIDAEGDTSIEKGEKTEIKIKVTGGIQPYSYSWQLEDGETSSNRILNFSYDEPGSYGHIVTVTDAAGNTLNKTVTISVKKLYKLTIKAKDSSTERALKDVTIEISNKDASTNSDGLAIFYLTKGTYNIYASHSSYEFYVGDDYKLKENSTKTISLVKVDNVKPSVAIVSPEEDSKLLGNKLNITFSVSDEAEKVVCEIYTNENDADWYVKRKTVEVTSTAEQKVTITGFSLGEYKVKIDCEDENNNVGEREIYVEFVNKTTKIGIDRKKNIVDELYSLLDNLPKRTVKQKQVLEALEFEKTIKQAIKTVERTTRDIYNVEYRRDLSDESKAEKQQELMKKIDEIYESVPIDIEVLSSKSFVKYIKEPELAPIVKEYASLKNYDNQDSYLKSAIEAQKEVTITTSVKVARMLYFNGVTDEITLVVRDLDYVNDTKNFKVIEYVPKEIADSADKLVILSDYEIIKDDPIIEFDSPKKIVYYLKKQKNLELFEKANTVILPATYKEALNSITGQSIFSFDTDLNGKTALIMLVIILVIIYGGYNLDSFDKVKFLYFMFFGDKKLHNMRMLINDALDNFEAKNYEKAYLIYREARLYYDKLSIPAKNEIYDSVVLVCNKLDFEYANQIYEVIVNKLKSGEKERARKLYKKLRAIYKKLNDEDRKKIYSDIMKISGRIAK